MVVTPLSYTTLLVPIIGLVIALVTMDLRLLIYTHVITGGTWAGIELFMGLVMIRVLKGRNPEARN